MLARRLLPTFGSLVLVLACAALGLGDDVVLAPDATIKAPGGRFVGTIQSESPTAVRIQPASGAAQDVPIDQIGSITYTGQPAAVALAESRERIGDLDGAAEQFKKAAGEASASKPLIVEAVRFAQARVSAEAALSDPSKVSDAITQLDGFVKAHPRGRHLAPALEFLSRLALAKNDTAKADEAATSLAAIPWAADKAAILKARVLVKKGQAGPALKTLDTLIAAAPKGSSKSIELRLARAETLAADNKFSDAETAVLEVIKETPPEKAGVQAVAHNTLGDCYRASGKLKDALFAYLKTDVLYDKDKEQHARALYEIAQLWRKLNQAERADDAMARLRQQYPQSPYIK